MPHREDGMRVDVWDGGGEKSLGQGMYLGDVALYYFAMPDGSLRSQTNAEDEPSTELITEMREVGAKMICNPFNPKILLDSGDVVYGCQVWWKRCD